jgi:glucokinase
MNNQSGTNANDNVNVNVNANDNANVNVVGIDLGATKIALGLINAQNEIVSQRRFPTDSHRGPEHAAARIGGAIQEMEHETGLHVSAVGMCSPGPVNHTDGIIVDPPNLHKSWHGVPFRQLLAETVHVPVSLEHDAKAAGLGEYHFGAGRGWRDMVFIIVGTGVGAAIILDGQLYRGYNNSAGEVGHFTINRRDRSGTSGVPGNVESYISGPALVAGYTHRLGAQAQQVESGADVMRLALQGDAHALATFEDAGDALAACIGTVAMVMDVALFVIGASVAKAGELLLGPARRNVRKYGFQSVTNRVRIEVTQLQDSGPILGCGWQARELVVGQRFGNG